MKSGCPSSSSFSGLTVLPFGGNETLLAAQPEKIKASTSSCVSFLFLPLTPHSPSFSHQHPTILTTTATTNTPQPSFFPSFPASFLLPSRTVGLFVEPHRPLPEAPSRVSRAVLTSRTEYCNMVLHNELSVLLVPQIRLGRKRSPPTCRPTPASTVVRRAVTSTSPRCGCFRFVKNSVEKEGYGLTRYPVSDLSIVTEG